MKLALVNTWDVMGGAAGIAVRLTKHMRDKGHEAVLLVGRKTRSEDWIIELPVWGDGTLVESLGRKALGLVSRKPASSSEVRHQWRRVVQKMNPASRRAAREGYEDFEYPGSRWVWERLGFVPDVVHLHNLHAMNGNTHFDLSLLPWLSERSQVMFTLHDAWLLTGHCGHFFACDRWKTGCGSCPDLATYPPIARDQTAENWRRRAEWYSKSRYTVTGPCNWVVEKARQSPLARGTVADQVIPNGVDLAWFAPQETSAAFRRELGIAPGHRVLSFVSEHGKLNPYRDFHFVEKMLAAYPKSGDGRGLTVLEIGGGVYRREESPERHWIGTGLIRDRARMRDVLAASDIVVHPAVADTFPTVVMESMACGTPVLSTAVCGIVDQITDGEDGLLVSRADPASAALRLHRLLQEEEDMQRMKAAARSRALRQFSDRAMLEAYEELYLRLADSR